MSTHASASKHVCVHAFASAGTSAVPFPRLKRGQRHADVSCALAGAVPWQAHLLEQEVDARSDVGVERLFP